MPTTTASSATYDLGPIPEVSIVVSTRNRATLLLGLFEALSAQTFGQNRFEVIAVDDGSTDGTWQTLEIAARQTQLRLLSVHVPTQGGQGPGRNIGVSHARAVVVAFTDDDCIPTPGWLEALCSPFLTDPANGLPHVVAQGRTVPWVIDQHAAGQWARTIWVLRPSWLFETCNIAYRRIDLIQAGGFPGPGVAPSDGDGKLVGEDALLGWNVIGSGAHLAFVPTAEVFHRHHAASYGDWVRGHRGRAVFPTLVRQNVRTRRALWGRYFLAPQTAAFDGAVICGALWLKTRRTRWLLGTLPWLWLTLPEAANREGFHPAFRLAQIGLGDFVGLTSLVSSSLRERKIVL